MEGVARREEIVKILTESKVPVSGYGLSQILGVSRQIVVGDIALLRAQGTEILSTNSGYVLAGAGVKTVRLFVRHKLEDSYDEICTIIDEGARILNEGIKHEVYGDIVVSVNISSRADAKRHTEAILSSNSEDLMILTGNNHFHDIEAPNDLVLLRVQKALRDKGYLTK